MNPVLTLNDYSIFCHLGCLPEERQHRQEVRVTVKIEFMNSLAACTSDKIEDTLCYAKMCKEIDTVANSKTFHTVEHLCWQILEQLKKIISIPSRCTLLVNKVSPPIDGLKGGVNFQLGFLM